MFQFTVVCNVQCFVCSVLQCVAVCAVFVVSAVCYSLCSVLQCAVQCAVFCVQCVGVCSVCSVCSVLHFVQCFAVCPVSCSLLQCAAVHCAVCEHKLLFCVGGHQRRWNLCRVPMMMTIMIIIVDVANLLKQKRFLKICPFNFSKEIIWNPVTGVEDGIQGWMGSTYIGLKA